jgi:prepilin-type processing-associated H-X9-DG protein
MISFHETGRRVAKQQSCDAFTLTELLVVLGTIGILSVILVPALAATKPGSKAAQCLNSKRQLTLAWQMYASDNSDSILSCTSWVTNGSFMDWSSSSANTNTDYLTNPTNALIARYVKSAAIFKCPADYYQSPAQSAIGPRVRSVSLNAALGGKPTFMNQNGKTYFSALKTSDLGIPGPAAVFAFLDEHPDSINDGQFMLDPGYAPGMEHWRDLPASYHNNAGSFSFADGHSEIHLWMVNKPPFPTVYPVTYQTSFPSPWAKKNLGANADYEWMENHMPYR